MNTPDPAYRLIPASGSTIRSDIVDVYIFQRAANPPPHTVTSDAIRGVRATRMDSDSPSDFPRPSIYFLQLLRVGAPMADTWHPIMGHMEAGETAVQCMRRELNEEVGLVAGSGVGGVGVGVGGAPLGLWALEQVHPFFIAEIDSIVMSPRFAAEVAPGWTPRLNGEHSAFRWVHQRDVRRLFMWPGQKSACREIAEDLTADGSLMAPLVRIAP